MSDQDNTPAPNPIGALRAELDAARQAVQRLVATGGGAINPQAEFASVYENKRRTNARRRFSRRPVRGPALWFAVWTLSFVKEVRSERLGLFWWFAEPFLLILVFTAMTLVFFGGTVAGMPSFPFAIIGVAHFVTFRTTFMTTAAGVGALSHCLHDPAVGRFDLGLGLAPRSMVANACVAGALLGYLIAADYINYPIDPPIVVLCLVMTACLGFSLGLCASLLAFLYRGFRKIFGIYMRLFGLTGGLFYVSEQLPSALKPFVLWNPIIHASQLSRDAWFLSYNTTDGSWVYLWSITLLVLCLGLGCSIMEKRRRAEAGDID